MPRVAARAVHVLSILLYAPSCLSYHPAPHTRPLVSFEQTYMPKAHRWYMQQNTLYGSPDFGEGACYSDTRLAIPR